MKKSMLLVVSIIFLLVLGCKESEPTNIILTEFTDEFDWRNEGILTTPKDQGNYGTCWAFATVGIVESVIKKELKIEVDLSEQHLVNSIPHIGPSNGLDFAKKFGILEEKKLPYEGERDASFGEEVDGDYKVLYSEFIVVKELEKEERIETIKSYIKEYGPILTHIDLTRDFTNYSGGIFEYDGRSQNLGGHIIIITGWKNDPSVKNGGYWICKNSSGINWGEGGYFRIAYDELNIALYYIGVVGNPQKI